MNKPLKALMVEDNPNDADLLAFELERGGYQLEFERVDTAEAFQSVLNQQHWDIIFSDHSMPQFSSTRALALFKETERDIPFIIISGTIGEEVAVQALKAGANDYMIKGNLTRLIPAVERELREAKERARYRKTEAVLKETETRFDATFEQAAVGIAHVGINGEWIRLNHKYCEILGYSQADLMGTTFQEVTHPDDLETDLELYQKLKDKEIDHYTLEKRYNKKDQSYIWVNLTVSIVWDERGQFDYAVAVIEDISKRKQIEETLKRAKEEAEVAKEVAETANRKKSEFLSIMTHELRTPLNAIIGYSEMIESGVWGGQFSEKEQRYIHNVVISGRHLLDLINEVLDVSKIEAGRMELTIEYAEVEPLIEISKIIVEEIARQKDVQLIFDIQSPLGEIQVDTVRFKQILFNLLSNAIKFNRPGGRVTLNASKETNNGEECLVISVQDTGIGIPQNKLSDLFHPFSQIDTSYARKTEGTGLGLALTKHLIEMHGGKITVESEEGVGSTFTLRMPLIPRKQSTNALDFKKADSSESLNFR